MRAKLVVTAVLLSGVLADVSAQEPAALFRGCTKCHGVPDPAVAGDTLWVGRVATTACVTPAGEGSRAKRGALIEWLRSDSRQRPSVEAAARTLPDEHGAVVANFKRGSVLLGPPGGAGEAADLIRLVWNGESGDAARRAVPAGTWQVRGYRVIRAGANRTEWQTWGSGRGGRRITVSAGATTRLDLELRVHLKARAGQRRGRLSVGVGVTGDSGMGLSVVRGGDRVPATYKLVGGDRAVTGQLAYG